MLPVTSEPELLAFEALVRAPLASGTVERLASGGPVVSRHRCVVDGAVAGAALDVRLLLHLFDPTCSGVPLAFAATRLLTDAAGRGSAELAVRAEDVPEAMRGHSHGVRWEVRDGEEALYRTPCAVLAIE